MRRRKAESTVAKKFSGEISLVGSDGWIGLAGGISEGGGGGGGIFSKLFWRSSGWYCGLGPLFG